MHSFAEGYVEVPRVCQRHTSANSGPARAICTLLQTAALYSVQPTHHVKSANMPYIYGVLQPLHKLQNTGGCQALNFEIAYGTLRSSAKLVNAKY